MIKPPLQFRDGTQGDIHFLHKAWLSQQRRFAHHSYMTRERFMAQYRRRILQILPVSKFKVAANALEPTVIYCAAVYTPLEGFSVLHFVATKFQYQKLGIARELLSQVIPPGEPIVCTSWSEEAQALRDKYKLVYDPYFERTL